MAGLLKALTLFALLPTATGCATVINGKSQKVAISSEPSGATITIDNVPRGTTPAIVALERKKPHVIRVDAPGYATVTSVATPTPRYGTLALNLLLSYPLVAAASAGADMVTGAYKRFEPGSFNLRLFASDTAAPGPSRYAPWQPAPTGSKVRVYTSTAARPTIGVVNAASNADALTLAGDDGAPVVIARQSVVSIDVSLGKDRIAGIARYAMPAGVIGMLIAGAIGQKQHGAEGAFFYAFLFGAPAGLGAGAITGLLIAPKEKWLKVQ